MLSPKNFKDISFLDKLEYLKSLNKQIIGDNRPKIASKSTK